MRVFIGYDPRQPVAFQVCAQSVWEHASKPVSITRLDLRTLPITRRGLTEFTYSRFLVPYLCGFEGTALFLDSDILVRHDVTILENNLWLKDVPVMLRRGPQKFEWASVMYFDNSQLKHLTPEFIENAENKMYDWSWCPNTNDLGKDWNHLVGYDEPNSDPVIVHFTQGIPIWQETKNCEFSKEWWATCNRCNSSVSFNELMGRSVHVPHMQLKGN